MPLNYQLPARSYTSHQKSRGRWELGPSPFYPCKDSPSLVTCDLCLPKGMPAHVLQSWVPRPRLLGAGGGGSSLLPIPHREDSANNNNNNNNTVSVIAPPPHIYFMFTKCQDYSKHFAYIKAFSPYYHPMRSVLSLSPSYNRENKQETRKEGALTTQGITNQNPPFPHAGVP